jgi:tetratricopeptide (TPR) repeat protein
MYRVILCAAVAILLATAAWVLSPRWRAARPTVELTTANDPIVCAGAEDDEAIEACNRVLALNRTTVPATSPAAFTTCTRAITTRRFPTSTKRSHCIGMPTMIEVAAYYSKGDYDRAISDYDQDIQLFPKHASAYAIRGEAHEAKNDFDHAIADFNEALKLDPSLAKAREGRERVQALLVKGR